MHRGVLSGFGGVDTLSAAEYALVWAVHALVTLSCSVFLTVSTLGTVKYWGFLSLGIRY